MPKSAILFILSLIYGLCSFSLSVNAQVVYKGLNLENSTFLLGNTSARKTQCIYKPSDFNTLPHSGLIDRIYFRYGSTGIAADHSLSPFTIKLGQTADTTFLNSAFFTGLSIVRFDSLYTISAGNQGDWFGINLQTPFAYDSTLSLILEIKFYNSTASNFGTLGNSNSGQKIISNDTAAIAQTGFGSSTWQDFGFDYLITTGRSHVTTTPKITISPNPTNNDIVIDNLIIEDENYLYIYDASGRTIYTEKIPIGTSRKVLHINQWNNGLYSVSIVSKQHHFSQKIIKTD